MAWNLVPGLFVIYKELSAASIGKRKFFKQADYIGYVIAKLSKYVKINMDTSSDCFLQKLTKFHCQTVFTSQVIQQNIFLASGKFTFLSFKI